MARQTSERSKRSVGSAHRQKAAREKITPTTKKGKAPLRRMHRDDGRPCEVCGNVYDKAFEITLADAANGGGGARVFDSFECAIHALAPTCAHCGCRVLGHGMEADGEQYCCAHCARAGGHEDLTDRVG